MSHMTANYGQIQGTGTRAGKFTLTMGS